VLEDVRGGPPEALRGAADRNLGGAALAPHTATRLARAHGRLYRDRRGRGGGAGFQGQRIPVSVQPQRWQADGGGAGERCGGGGHPTGRRRWARVRLLYRRAVPRAEEADSRREGQRFPAQLVRAGETSARPDAQPEGSGDRGEALRRREERTPRFR